MPLGVFLSSGVDSSAVANLAQQAMSKITGERINTFTLVFEEKELSEGVYAKQIADAIGTNHREITLTESTFVDNIDRAMDTLDQPTFDGLNSFYMSKAVREAGLTVALVGTGGDELFGGYTSFRDLPKLHAWAARSRWMPRSAKVAAARAAAFVLQKGKTGGAMRAQTRWAKLPDMVGCGEDLVAIYQLAYALFLPQFQQELLADGMREDSMRCGLAQSLHAQLVRETAQRSALSGIGVLEQRIFLAERLLCKRYRTRSKHGGVAGDSGSAAGRSGGG